MLEPQIVSFADYRRAAATLAVAFKSDLVAKYICDIDTIGEDLFHDLNMSMLSYIVYAHLLNGEVWQIDNFSAVALWMPPGKNMDDLWTILRSGLWRLWFKLTFTGRNRLFSEFFPLLHSTKADIDPQNTAWYLVYIGTVPEARGKGYARRLVEPVMTCCQKEGSMIYLENSNPQNIRFYERLGFNTIRKIQLGGNRTSDTNSEHIYIPLDIMVFDNK